jgi:hypothetical protein
VKKILVPVLLEIRHVGSDFVISTTFVRHKLRLRPDETLDMDFTTKHPDATIENRFVSDIAIIDKKDFPTLSECREARRLLALQTGFTVCYATHKNKDGVYLGNLWKPEPLMEARHLPHEHPFRNEWNTSSYDVPWLDCSHEALPQGWLPSEFKRLFAWEVGIYLLRKQKLHHREITQAAYRGYYKPMLLFVGCNAVQLQPEPHRYQDVAEGLVPGKRMLTQDIVDAIIQVKARFAKCELQALSSPDSKRPFIIPQAALRPTHFQITVGEAESTPMFYWRIPAFTETENLRNLRAMDYPENDLSEESGDELEGGQYEWDTPAYDDFSLDFSHTPTPPGWTRIQHLRYSAYCVNLAKLRMARFRRRW